jgi:tetratricopeptide (TPR) repeat protein
MLGRTAEAISALRKAIELNPRPAFGPSELARYLLIEGNTQEALQWTTKLRTEGYIDSALAVEGPLYAFDFQFDKAASSMRQLTASSSAASRSEGHSLLSRLFAESGQMEYAKAELEAALNEERQQGDAAGIARELTDRAYIECSLDEVEACLDDIDTASRSKLIPYVVFTSLDALALVDEAPAAPLRTKAHQILRTLQQAVASDESSVAEKLMILRITAEESLLSGKTQQAVRLLHQAADLDAPANPRAYLAHGLLAQARLESRSTAARPIRLKALQQIELLPLKPGFLWHDALEQAPGVLTAQMKMVLDTASTLGISDANTQFCAKWLAMVRQARVRLPAPRSL